MKDTPDYNYVIANTEIGNDANMYIFRFFDTGVGIRTGTKEEARSDLENIRKSTPMDGNEWYSDWFIFEVTFKKVYE